MAMANLFIPVPLIRSDLQQLVLKFEKSIQIDALQPVINKSMEWEPIVSIK